MSGEILTLQLGHYSNYVGAHWWNIQDLSFQYNSGTPSEINHDVLYREGVNLKRQITFTPRLLLVDLQDSLGSLPKQGDLYESNSGTSKRTLNWDGGSTEIQVGPSQSKNKFQKDLDGSKKTLTDDYKLEDSKVWSDFLYSKFHPRTVEIVKGYQLCNENTPFDVFPLGQSIWKSQQFSEDFTDKIRNYIEECDHLQGFHFLTDCTNAFSGLSSSCLEYIQDEYERKSILVVPVIPSHFPDNDLVGEEKFQSVINDSVRVANLALSFTDFNKYSTLFVPLSVGSKGWKQPGPHRIFENLEYNPKLAYHSSAIIAAALDTITLKYRLKQSLFTLKDLCADLYQNGRKAVAASIQMPFPMKEGGDLLECLDNWQGPLSQSITPSCDIGVHRLLQHVTLRGINEEKLKKNLNNADKQRHLPAYRCETIEEMLSLYLSYSTEGTANNVTVTQTPLTVKIPFPHIFKNNINSAGYITENVQDKSRVQSMPILAGLHNGSEIGTMIESLHTEARKIKINKFHQFTTSGIEKDDYEECLDNLFSLRENYEDSYMI